MVSTAKNYTTSSRLSAGSYTLKLDANDRGCNSSKTITFIVNPRPAVGFTNQPSSFCKVPQLVNFTNASTPSGSSYSWSFGNGQLSAAQNPSTTYTSLGAYDVKLVVTTLEGCKDSLTRQVKSSDPAADIVGRNAKKGCVPFSPLFRLYPGQAKAFASMQWSYNTTVLSNDSQFTYTFNDTGIYVITLKAITAEGCEVILKDSVRVGMKFKPNFTADKFIDCYSTINPVKFTGTGAGNVKPVTYTYLWKNGTSNEKDPSVIFSDTGQYNIYFAIEHYGCISDTTKFNFITVLPAKAFFAVPVMGCAMDSIKLINTSVGKNKYRWYFGDGDSSVLKNPSKKYLQSGKYIIKLIATDTTFNCPDTFTREVIIPETPEITFTLSDTVGCAPLRVGLTNTTVISPGGLPIVGYYWQFSSRSSSNLQNPTLDFTQPGYTKVTLTIYDSRNCPFTLIKDSAIKVIGGKALISAVNPKGCVPLTTVFKDNSTTEYPVVLRKWKWSATDSLVTPNNDTFPRLFTNPANPQNAGHTIQLTVTDSFGCNFTASSVVVPTLPVARINISRSFRCGSQTVTYNTPASPDAVFGTPQYIWKTGLSSQYTAAASQVYTHVDTMYAVSLKVTDGNGCIATADTLIPVSNKKPKAGFYANPRMRECFKPIIPINLFDTTILGATPIKSWAWVIGMNVSDKQNPNTVFQKPGKYAVRLVIEDSAGCIDSAVIPDYIILKGPTGDFSFTPGKGCMPHSVDFKVTSPNAKYIKMDLGDGLVDTFDHAFGYVYLRPGVYHPKLTLIDSSGTCDDGRDAIDSIVVHPLPKPDFETDKTIVCINTLISFVNKTPESAKITDWFWKINDTTLTGFTPQPLLFTKSGRYKISLTAQDHNTCIDSITKSDYVTVIDDTIPPQVPNVLRASVTGNTSTVLELKRNNEIDFASYRIYYNYFSGSPANTAIHTIDDTVFVHQGINTLENPYTYAVAAIDLCNNLSLPSELHTTVELKARNTDNAIALAWTPYQGFDTIDRYEIWRNNKDSGDAFVHIHSVNGDSLNYTDTSITCFTTYFYRIKTVERSGDTQVSWSDTSGATPDYAPTMPSTSNIRATVVNDSYILLQWHRRTHEIPFKYFIYKMRDDETEPIAYKEMTDTFLLDTDVDVDNHSYTYYTYLRDNCGGLSPSSNMAKTILLKVNLKENDLLKYDPVITFTRYNYWETGVNKYEADFYYDSARAFSPVTTLTPDDTSFFHKYVNLQQRDYCYKVTAHENGSEVTSESNIACIDTKPRLYAPNVFTINNDGLNDKFELGGVFLDTYNIKIFNRWGQQVFESNDIHTSWDGTVDGKPAPSDVYVYIAEGTGRKNQRISIKGNVTILR
ncbi:MAG: PKD domain-containing protein [Bacteroidota bacterium]